MKSFTDKVNDQRREYQDALRAGTAIGVASTVMPRGVGAAIGLLNDQKIKSMEEENPSLINDPFNPRRFSTVGQVLFGYGYPQQQGIPAVSAWDRLRNSLGLGGDTRPNPQISMWNAKGVPMTVTQPSSSGWETDGGGYGPSEGMTNYGGFESMVSDDKTGYA